MPRRRPSVWLLFGVLATAAWTPASQAAGPRFAPYVDETFQPHFSLTSFARRTGTRAFTLGFIIARGPRCQAAWGGTGGLRSGGRPQTVQALRQGGGKIVLSFGGAGGRELSLSCPNARALAGQYLNAARSYHARQLDFDIEGKALTNRTAVERRSAAIALLERRLPGAEVVLTLPASTHGFSPDSLATIRSALAHHVHVVLFNAMTMDFGNSDAPSPTGRMGYYVERSALGVHRQLQNLLPRSPSAQLWGMIGLTPMIGVNDVSDEVFTLRDAQDVLGFARQHGVGGLALWSANRDRSCPAGIDTRRARPSCSGVSQRPGQFSSLLAQDG